ncbi:MAG: hypothetical protein Q8Q59_16195 [Luteolibacter sp.]|jgi:hypothetical protein|nr:hypothetical protein [Luteolibacter sp.]
MTRRYAFIACSALVSLVARAQDAVMEKMPAVFERAATQYSGMLEKVAADPNFPRTAKPDGTVVTVKAEDWTSGFFPGNLWFLHEFDGSPKWRKVAMEYTTRLETIRHFKGNHDGGFMLGCSYGNALRLSPDDSQRAVLRDAAAALGTRFVPELGLIRSWDHKPFISPVIIDNMMNLELLTWAAKTAAIRNSAISPSATPTKRSSNISGRMAPPIMSSITNRKPAGSAPITRPRVPTPALHGRAASHGGSMGLP